MSDTPRTDSAARESMDMMNGAVLRECKALERELNAEKQHITELENRLRALWDKLEGERKYYQDRIKRLEEAGDALSKTQTYDLLENVNWRKAKEAKP